MNFIIRKIKYMKNKREKRLSQVLTSVEQNKSLQRGKGSSPPPYTIQELCTKNLITYSPNLFLIDHSRRLNGHQIESLS